MTVFKSDPVSILASPAETYTYLNDFNNFEKLLPDQVTNWQCAGDQCSFTIQGMADIALRIDQRDPDKKIVYVSEGKTPFEFQLQFILDSIADNRCSVVSELQAKLNPMLKMMASRPLQNLVNILVEQLKTEMESAS
jgi:carbon monoxide dehydrogenase subunit G